MHSFKLVTAIVIVGLAMLVAACESTEHPADITAAGDGAASESQPDPAQPFDYCQPGTPPDWECFRQKRAPDSDNIKLALAIATNQLGQHPPETLPWNWEEAVLLLALADLYRVTEEPQIFEYCKAWMDHHIAAGYQVQSSDTCVPAAVAVMLLEETGQEKYGQVVADALHYLNNEAIKTEEGGISHLGNFPVVSLWVDSLFMFGSVLVRYGRCADHAESLDFFGDQVRIFRDVLQDDNGFFRHAHGWVIEPDQPVYWARGNGWVAASAYHYLRVRSMRGESDLTVRDAAGKLLFAAIDAQDPSSGLWWNILDKPGEIYLETSGSALFVYGLARAFRYGYVGDEVLDPIGRGLAGLKQRISFDGAGTPIVTGISGPTTADRHEYYAGVPLEDDLAYGLGAVIFALTETSGLPGMEEE